MSEGGEKMTMGRIIKMNVEINATIVAVIMQSTETNYAPGRKEIVQRVRFIIITNIVLVFGACSNGDNNSCVTK